MSIGAGITSQVIGIKFVLSTCSLSVYCVLHLVNMKLGSPTFKVLHKIGGEICSRTLVKNGDWFNENLGQETIFLATTLNGNETLIKDVIKKHDCVACIAYFKLNLVSLINQLE